MTTAAQVQLVFRGEVLPGFQVDDVKRALGERLRTDEQGLTRMFSAPRTVLKRAVDPAEAARYVATFARLGAILHAEHADTAPATRPAAAGGAVPLPTIVPPPEAPPAPIVRSGPPAPAPIPAAKAPPPAPAALALVPEEATAAAAVEAGADMVTCPNCGERQTRRLLCRGCTTNIEMALAAKAEAVAASRAAVLAERQRKYGVKAGLEPERTADSEPSGLWGLRFEGRMGRPTYWTGGLIGMTVLYVLTLLLIQRPDTGRWILFFIGWVVYLSVSLRWTAMRFHDLNASGWWAVVLTVPYVGSAAGLVLSFVPGSPGDNDYGEPPPEGRWRNVAIAGGVFLLTLALTFSSLMNATVRLMADDDDDLYESISEPAAGAPPGLSATGRAAFEGHYVHERPFKAFAASPSGPWGWSSAQPSLKRAVQQAMQNCESQRRPDQGVCEIVDASAQ